MSKKKIISMYYIRITKLNYLKFSVSKSELALSFTIHLYTFYHLKEVERKNLTTFTSIFHKSSAQIYVNFRKITVVINIKDHLHCIIWLVELLFSEVLGM